MPDRSRFLTLVAIESTRLGKRFGIRAARVLGILIAIGYGLALVALSDGGSPLITTALFWLSWLVAGTAALSAARELGTPGADDGFAALLAQRGLAATRLGPVRLVAAALWISRVMALPAVALAVLSAALADSAAHVLSALVLSTQVLGYCVLLGATLAVLAHWAALLQPARAGLMLFALVMVPELIRETWSSVPSVPAFFGSLLDQLSVHGARE